MNRANNSTDKHTDTNYQHKKSRPPTLLTVIGDFTKHKCKIIRFSYSANLLLRYCRYKESRYLIIAALQQNDS